MKLTSHIIPEWPKLAWVASIHDRSDEIEVFHGPMVEAADEWVVEAVWAGDFEQGDFDRTDLVFGSGIRIRGDQVLFVSSGTTFDRLWYVRIGAMRYVSNSLPALLALAGLTLPDDYPDYSRDMLSIMKGLDKCVTIIPTTTQAIQWSCFHNLSLQAADFRRCEKPDVAPPFARFADYYAYVCNTAKALAENMTNPSRQNKVLPLATISSGYDSAGAAAIAKQAGCSAAVTIVNSSSLWRGSDSGKPIAEALGLACREYERTASHYPDEVTIWSATGRASEMTYTLFEYPQPLTALFTGYHGDKVWGRDQHDIQDPFRVGGYSGRGLCEFRLHRGFFHCCVPFWGFRRASELQLISWNPEMFAWTLGTAYDRPIPRRILEENGVPRRAFGVRKRIASHETRFRWPYSADAHDRFVAYLQARALSTMSRGKAAFLRRVAHFDTLIRRNLPGSLTRRIWRSKDWDAMAHSQLLFQWANDELKQQYIQSLRASLTQPAGVAEIHTP